MKKFFNVLLLAVLSLSAFAQTLSKEDSAILHEITSNTTSIKSFTCTFTQVREDPLLEEPSVSRGQMQYRDDGTVVWKCTSPEPYQVTILKEKIIFAGGGKNRTINPTNHMMGNMRKLIEDVASGRAFDETDSFEVSVDRGKSSVSVRMIPQKKILQNHLSSVTMKFFADNLLIDKFMYSTPEGVSTTVSFSDWKIERND